MSLESVLSQVFFPQGKSVREFINDAIAAMGEQNRVSIALDEVDFFLIGRRSEGQITAFVQLKCEDKLSLSDVKAALINFDAEASSALSLSRNKSNVTRGFSLDVTAYRCVFHFLFDGDEMSNVLTGAIIEEYS